MSRPKVSVTVDPELLGVVDAFVAAHPGQDRSKVIDLALQSWLTQLQHIAMEAQFSSPHSKAAEQEAWRSVRRTAAAQRLKRR